MDGVDWTYKNNLFFIVSVISLAKWAPSSIQNMGKTCGRVWQTRMSALYRYNTFEWKWFYHFTHILHNFHFGYWHHIQIELQSFARRHWCARHLTKIGKLVNGNEMECAREQTHNFEEYENTVFGLVRMHARLNILQQFRIAQIEMWMRCNHWRSRASVQIQCTLQWTMVRCATKTLFHIGRIANFQFIAQHRQSKVFGFRTECGTKCPTHRRLMSPNALFFVHKWRENGGIRSNVLVTLIFVVHIHFGVSVERNDPTDIVTHFLAAVNREFAQVREVGLKIECGQIQSGFAWNNDILNSLTPADIENA